MGTKSLDSTAVEHEEDILSEGIATGPAQITVSSAALEALNMDSSSFQNLVLDAKKAADEEHGMPVFKAIQKYPQAVLWSMLLSAAVVMEGYDLTLMGNLFAQPQFAHKYGKQLPSGQWEVPSRWQSALSLGPVCGEIIGLFINSFATERFGYRRVMLASLAAMAGLIFIVFFAVNIEMLLVGEILCGIPWGIFQVITTTYAADVCPITLRPVLTAYVNLCWVFGQLIASGVLRGCLDRPDEWAYRIPFALQWMWPIPIMVGCFFAPESPWWLARKGRMEEAKHSLARLKRRPSPSSIESADENARLAMIIHTQEIEKRKEAGATMLDCFKGVDLRRTETCCVTWLVQNTCGSAFMGYSTYFLQQAGMAVDNSFNLSIAQYAIAGVGTVSSWALMSRIGRRKIYMCGLATLFVILMAIGGVGCIKTPMVLVNGVSTPTNSGPSWAVGGMLLAYTLVYALSVGPVCYPLVAELSSTRLRTLTVVVARVAYNLSGIVNFVLMPLMLNPGAWNWKAKSGFFWAGLCFLGLLWTYFRLPEPKDRTYAELDLLFANKVSARKFATTKVDPYIIKMMMSEEETELKSKKLLDGEVSHVENA